MIGTVGTLLGDAGVNIADMDVGRASAGRRRHVPGTAVMLIAPTSPVAQVTVEALRAAPGIIERRRPDRLTPSVPQLFGRDGHILAASPEQLGDPANPFDVD